MKLNLRLFDALRLAARLLPFAETLPIWKGTSSGVKSSRHILRRGSDTSASISRLTANES